MLPGIALSFDWDGAQSNFSHECDGTVFPLTPEVGMIWDIMGYFGCQWEHK